MMVAMVKALVCMCLCVFACEVRGSYIPPDMNRTIQNLLQHYKISLKDKFNGRPVFSREPLTGRLENKMLFLGGVLDTYEKLIGQMLKQLPTPSPHTDTVQSKGQPPSAASTAAALRPNSRAATDQNGNIREMLTCILKKVTDLKNNSFQEQENLLQRLQALKHIKMDNHVVQSKALWELPWLYEEASSLSDSFRNQRRRRRQAKGKTRPRV